MRAVASQSAATASVQQPLTNRRTARVALVVVAGASIALAAISAATREPWSDEGQFSSAAYNLAHHGFLGTTVLDPTTMGLTRIQQRTYWVLPLFLAGEAAWYKLAPATLFWTRMFSICWAPLALFAFHRIMRLLVHDSRIAWLATSLLALDYYFIDNSGFARPDLMCMALGWSGLAVYLSIRERSLRAALFGSNLLLAASALTHPNAVLYLAGLAVLMFFYDRRRIRVPELAIAILPYMVLGGFYAVYILRDSSAWADQMRANGTNGRWAGTINPFRIIRDEIVQRYLVAYGFMTERIALLKSVSLFSFVAAFAGVLATPTLRQKPAVRLLLSLWAAYFAIQCVFNQKLSYYLVHIIPLYIAIFSVWLVWLWDRAPKWRPVFAAWVLVLMLLPAGGILWRARQRKYYGAEHSALAFVQQNAPAATSIMGSAALIYDMDFDSRLLDDLLLGVRSGKRADVIVITPLYEDVYNSWTNIRAADAKAVRARLAEYRLAYDASGYRVYLR